MRMSKKVENITYLESSTRLGDSFEPILGHVKQVGGEDDDGSMTLFDQAVSQYYLQKAKEHDLSSLEAVEMNAVGSNELAHRLLILPAGEPRQVLMKLNILENELATDMDLAAPVDRKHLVSFAALKADLIGLLAQMAE